MTTELIAYKNTAATNMPNAFLRRILNTIPGWAAEARARHGEASSSHLLDAFLAEAGRHGQAVAADQDGWKRTLDATLALLRYAHITLERTEAVVAEQAARISQLEALVTTDELTGLKNRRGFFERFVAELDCCERGLSEGGLLVLIDLDNFKAINDGYGHLAGDACLRLVAATLAEDVRLMDTAARLGGDEFVLLLSNTTRKAAAGRAQQLAWRLNNLSLAWQGEVIPVRASLGLQNYARGDKPEHIFRAADDNLYGQKSGRRDDNGSALSFPEKMRMEGRSAPRARSGSVSLPERIRTEF